MSREQSSLGAAVYYGPRTSDKGLGHTLATSSSEVDIVIPFDYANLPATSADDAGVPTIPAGASVVEARLEVKTDFSGGSVAKMDIGLAKPDGTAIDAAGLFNDAGITAGWQNGSGALIGASVGADDAQVVVAPLTATDTAASPTAGEAVLYLKVRLPGA